MPELPEVEVTTRKLKPLIVGRRILLARRSLGEGGRFNRKILGLERRGKAILIHLSGNKILGFHQRMSGRLLVVPRHARDKHIRRRFRLSNGRDLAFHDVRKFGVVWYGSAKKALSDKYFRTLGEDALSISFVEFKKILRGLKNNHLNPSLHNPLNPPYLKGEIDGKITKEPLSLRRRGVGGEVSLKPRLRVGAVKAFLLNQKNLAGIGNIMADEILWHARIHPKRDVRGLSEREVRNLWSSLRAVLKRSIKMGGSTMRDWFHPDGDRGGYFEKRRVYDREGSTCFRCKAKILRKKIAGRSSYFCPKCQML